MAAIDTLLEVAERAFWIGQKDQEFRRIHKPGEFFKSLPPHVQKQLRGMKSSEYKNVRLDAILWMLGPPDERFVRFVREHYEAERRAYLKKHPYRRLDDEWDF